MRNFLLFLKNAYFNVSIWYKRNCKLYLKRYTSKSCFECRNYRQCIIHTLAHSYQFWDTSILERLRLLMVSAVSPEVVLGSFL